MNLFFVSRIREIGYNSIIMSVERLMFFQVGHAYVILLKRFAMFFPLLFYFSLLPVPSV